MTFFEGRDVCFSGPYGVTGVAYFVIFAHQNHNQDRETFRTDSAQFTSGQTDEDAISRSVSVCHFPNNCRIAKGPEKSKVGI